MNTGKKLYNSSWKYDRKPLLEENCGKIADFSDETCFKIEVKSPTPSQWNITVSSITNLVQLAIRKYVSEQIPAMQSMDNS